MKLETGANSHVIEAFNVTLLYLNYLTASKNLDQYFVESNYLYRKMCKHNRFGDRMRIKPGKKLLTTDQVKK